MHVVVLAFCRLARLGGQRGAFSTGAPYRLKATAVLGRNGSSCRPFGPGPL